MEDLVHEIVQYVVRIDTLAVDVVVELRSPILTKVMNSVTGLGSGSAGLVFLGLFYLAEWRTEFRRMMIALVLSGLVVGTLMITFKRPYPDRAVCLTGGAETVAHSFPSGHAAVTGVYAMIARRSEELPFKITAAAAVIVAFSRFYLGTHYLSDTVVGVLIGVGAVLVAERIDREY